MWLWQRAGRRALLLGCAIVMIAACACQREENASVEPKEEQAAAAEVDPLQVAQLEALGYASAVEEAGHRLTGVHVHDPERTTPGFNLYVSGHREEAILMDSEGRELHRWHYPRDLAFPGLGRIKPPSNGVYVDNLEYFRRAYLYPNGDLLAVFEGIGLLKIDRDSNLLWSRRNRSHHDLQVLPDGTIYTLVRATQRAPWLGRDAPVTEDFVVELAPDGSERRRVSLLRALGSSEHRDLVGHADPRLSAAVRAEFGKGDLQHTNSLQILLEDPPGVPWLRAGHALVSSRHLSAVMFVDLEEERVLWLKRGRYIMQHDATLLPDGRLLLFDNHDREHGSRAVEISLETGEEVWQFPAEGTVDPIYSHCCGTAQRFPNGNTLIVNTDSGTALEVTREGELVWEFVSPHRARNVPTRVARLFDLIRLPLDFPLDWTAAQRETPGAHGNVPPD